MLLPEGAQLDAGSHMAAKKSMGRGRNHSCRGEIRAGGRGTAFLKASVIPGRRENTRPIGLGIAPPSVAPRGDARNVSDGWPAGRQSRYEVKLAQTSIRNG